METQPVLRAATPADAPALLAIYAPYVKNTAVTFELEAPSAEEFAARIRRTLARYPYLVAEEDGRPAGYAYVSPFKVRAAYDWSVETSIYLRQGCRGKGLGRALYAELEELLRRQHILNLNACISHPRGADPHLDDASEGFHAHLGYRRVAHFTQCGYKFGTWYDMVWMEKMLGAHEVPPLPVIPFPELKKP
jgi:phosphinothricin acetyltransferase